LALLTRDPSASNPVAAPQDNAPALAAFKDHFQHVAFHKGTEIRLAMSRDGTLRTVVDSVEAGSLRSPALCQAITDIYVGADPPSATAKADFCQTMTAVLARKGAPPVVAPSAALAEPVVPAV